MSQFKGSRSSCALTIAATAAIGMAAISPASAAADWSGRVCYMGQSIRIWVEWNFDNIDGAYDPATHAGLITYNTDGPFSPDDFQATIPDNAGGLITLDGGQENVMGSFEVIDGLGTAQCTMRPISWWVGAYGYSIHIIFDVANPPTVTMPLTGFTASGEGVYSIEGLNIPVQCEVTAPDGSVFIIPDVLHALEFRSPLELSAPLCFADQDQNGIFDLTDINLFIQGFLSRCE